MELTGRIVGVEGTVAGRVRFGRTVEAIEPGSPAGADDPWIVPGFVDLHLHGGGGGDVMTGVEGVRRTCRFHASQGTTAVLPTTLTAPFEQLEHALGGIREVMEKPGSDEARVLGCHLEGPWISPGRLGAQPAFAREPQEWEVERLLEMASVQVVTLAPEVPGVLELTGDLAGRGVRVQVGHSQADAATVNEALAAGASGFTHLFNAMPTGSHREPGVALVALARAEWAEIIVDGHHVGAEAVRAALRAIPGLYAVSDAIPATGRGDGETRFAGQKVTLREGVARTGDGTLAGSVSTLLDALRALVAGGLSIEEAARRVATVPADYLGRTDLGRIAPGAAADLVVLGPDLDVRAVWRDGQQLEEVR